jgi:signal recognition particle receptor subunit beta
VSQMTATATKTCRILYYGPQNVGKRDNLRLIHSSVPPENRLSLASGDPERQIAFRFANEAQGSWQVLVQCVDTGKERYRSAGMNDQPPFDGIVFVVSSRAGLLDQAMAAMESLKTYLDTWGLDLLEVPLVIQYNDRENADTLPVDKLESLINPWGLLSLPCATSRGEGVKETLKAILGLTVNHLKNQPQPVQAQQPASDILPPVDDPNPEPPNGEDGGLVLEYGPPVPGSEVEEATYKRGEAIFDELRPPIVIPVRIPRRLLAGDGPVRILLEVEIDDGTY